MSGTVDVKTEDECLDLSIKDVWLIVYYQDCDPGNEFEILHHNKLAENSWNTLRRGVFVTVMFGCAKVQAIVVYVSDDLTFLQSHLKSIGEEFLQEFYGETDLAKIMQNRRQKRRKNNYPVTQCFHGNVQRQVIKVADKECQTDEDDAMKYNALQNEYNELKTRYDRLEQKLHGFQTDIKTVLTKIDPNTQSNLSGPNPQPSTSGVAKSNNQPSHKMDNKYTPKSTYPRNAAFKADAKTNKEATVDENDENVLLIGSGKTKVLRHVFDSINWHNYSTATRKLLMHVFPRSTLATHSLTGKPSPAFLMTDKQAKMRLDPSKIGDIVETVSRKCMVTESLVRSAITTKCADENKMYKKRLEKKAKENDEDEVQAKRAKTR